MRGQILTAMTIFLLLVAALVLTELVSGVRLLLQDRPRTPPPSHLDWSNGPLPSGPPYSLRS
jgi:hypothetical protein